MGDWTWVVLDRMGLELFPSVADALYLGGLLVTAGAIIGLLHDRIPGGDRAGLIDALVVAVGAGLLSWTFLMEPLVSDPVASMGEIAVAIAYPVIDILLLGVLVRLFLAPGRRVPALKLILLALVVLVLTDFPYAVVALEGGYYTGHILDAGWLAASFLWASAALHPSMRNVAEPVEIGEVQLTPMRLAMLAGASLMAPAVLVIQAATGQTIDVVGRRHRLRRPVPARHRPPRRARQRPAGEPLRAAHPRGGARAPRAARPAHRAAEPRPLLRPARARPQPPIRAGRRPVHGPRRLQDGERHVRPPGRRRAAVIGGRRDSSIRARLGHGRAPRR